MLTMFNAGAARLVLTATLCARTGFDVMELFFALLLVALVWRGLNVREQSGKVRFLAERLQPFRVEKHMADVQVNTMRALSETDPERQASIWALTEGMQSDLCRQLNAFVLAFAKADPNRTRVSRWAMAIPYLTRWVPSMSFDLRKVLGVHAEGLQYACNLKVPVKEKAFVFMAEMLLLQHSCHWFCRSKLIASARLWTQHQTPYAQVLANVTPATRRSYAQLLS